MNEIFSAENFQSTTLEKYVYHMGPCFCNESQSRTTLIFAILGGIPLSSRSAPSHSFLVPASFWTTAA